MVNNHPQTTKNESQGAFFMKKTLIHSTLLSLIMMQAYADVTPTPTQATSPTPTSTTPAPTTPTPTPTTPTPTTPTPTTPTDPTPTPSPVPVNATAATQTSNTVIGCAYHIAPNAAVDEATLKAWTKNAVEQSFNFDHQTLASQLGMLKSCYTMQGWQSFNEALQKSGNIEAIKKQQLATHSQVKGEPIITKTKEQEWKAQTVLEVMYQNNHDKLTQLLTVDLVIGRKASGDLGIMQIIASPKTP